jgi:hypothetical protein
MYDVISRRYLQQVDDGCKDYEISVDKALSSCSATVFLLFLRSPEVSIFFPLTRSIYLLSPHQKYVSAKWADERKTSMGWRWISTSCPREHFEQNLDACCVDGALE